MVRTGNGTGRDRRFKGSRLDSKWTLTAAGIARHWADVARQWAGYRRRNRRVFPPLALPEWLRRLFAAAGLRSPRVWSVLDGHAREAVELADRHADGLASDGELVDARRHLDERVQDIGGTLLHGAYTEVRLAIELPAVLMRAEWDQLFVGNTCIFGGCAAAFAHARERVGAAWPVEPGEGLGNREVADAIGEQEERAIRLAEWSYQGQLLAGIVAPDWRLAPAWPTATAVPLARGIYDERAFDRMPILADALQDAGCDNDEWLGRMRDPHWAWCRGCHVVDSLVGASAP